MTRVLHETELVGASLVYLLEIEWLGRTFRWASVPITVSSDDGDLYFHGADIEAEIEQSFDFETDSPGDLSIQLVELQLPGDVDVPLLVERGHRLETAVGEVSVLPAGSTYEERYVLLRGPLIDPVYDDVDSTENAVSFSIEEETLNDTALFPPAQYIISEHVFFGVTGYSLSKSSPFVFGYPSYTGVDKLTPALPVDDANHRLMIHMSDIYTGYGIGITIYDETADADIAGCTITWFTDSSGWSYTGVQLDLADYDSSHKYWVKGWGFAGGALVAAGQPSLDYTEPLYHGGDLLLFMLLQSSIDIDRGRAAVAQELLNRYELHGYIDERVRPIEWIQDQLKPIMPFSLMSGPQGWYPVVWRYDAERRDAVAHLVEGPDFAAIGGVETDARDLCNEYSISFAPDGDGGHLRTITISGQYDDFPTIVGGTTKDYDKIPNLYARASYCRYKQLYADRDETDLIFDDEVAGQVAMWKIRSRAFAARHAFYEASVRHAWIEPGSVILVTHPERHWDEKIALVRGRSWNVTGILFDLLLLDDPPRDAKTIT